jgi:hypothetical protein
LRRNALQKASKALAIEEVGEEASAISEEARLLKEWRSRIKIRMNGLGEGNTRKLKEMRGDQYLRARVNARTLRENIRRSLVAHKFERSRLERNYRAQIQSTEIYLRPLFADVSIVRKPRP